MGEGGRGKGYRKKQITQSAAALLDMGQFWINLATITRRQLNFYLFISLYGSRASERR